MRTRLSLLVLLVLGTTVSSCSQEPTAEDSVTREELRESLKVPLSRAPVFRQQEGGTMSADPQGGHREVMIVRTEPGGSHDVKCVNTMEAAEAAFFGTAEPDGGEGQ